MPLNEKEKKGVEDLLISEKQNMHILYKVASSVTGNVVDIASTQEALDFVATHIRDLPSLLTKRSITKEVLFKYLHCKRVPVASDFTKATLINKVIEYWDNADLEAKNEEPTSRVSDPNEASDIPSRINSQSPEHQEVCPDHFDELQYPIHLLARKFSEWFFDNYNKDLLKEDDFWSDARLMLRIAANDRVEDQECLGAAATVKSLLTCKQQFEFYFNPNLTHAGVQGRMDVHGLVLVLACGTLHTQVNCVGVFECTFGLMRDPFSDNNWRVKTTQMMLRSKGSPDVPSLGDSQTLQDAMALPIPRGDFS